MFVLNVTSPVLEIFVVGLSCIVVVGYWFELVFCFGLVQPFMD